jgi:hypothetical protein
MPSLMEDGDPGRRKARGLDPVWYAMSKLRRAQYEECIKLCSDVLEENQLDQVSGKQTRMLMESPC